jgi:hypothetical protein
MRDPGMTRRMRLLPLLAIFLLPLSSAAATGEVAAPGMEDTVASKDGRLLLGVGFGVVRFDVNAKLTDRDTGFSRYIDLEGNLGLDEHSNVRTLYGSYLFNSTHSVVFNYFDVSRKSTLLSFDASYEDLKIENARLDIFDESRFYNIGYGYKLFANDTNGVTLVAGLNVLDLRLLAEASGDIIEAGVSRSESEVVEAKQVAPLPLIGLNFTTRYTPEWSLGTRVAFIAGSYQDVSAQIFQTSILSRYQFSKHVGLLFGITYFSAEVDIREPDELLEISYGYDGLFLGLHFGL